MPVQTSYAAYHDAAFEGQRSELSLINIISKAAEGSAIAFGRAVVRGTADDQAKLPSDGLGDLVGISTYTSAWGENPDGVHQYTENREMNIVDYGEIWVYTEQSVVPGDPVFFRHTATTAPLDVVGRFRKDDGSGLATQIKGATFESAAAAGALAKVKLVGVETENVVTVVATSGALSLNADVVIFDTTAGASTSTLADGVEGQEIVLTMEVDGGNQVLTPANLTAGSTITFADVGDTVTLRFTSGSWVIISNVGAAVA